MLSFLRLTVSWMSELTRSPWGTSRATPWLCTAGFYFLINHNILYHIMLWQDHFWRHVADSLTSSLPHMDLQKNFLCLVKLRLSSNSAPHVEQRKFAICGFDLFDELEAEDGGLHFFVCFKWNSSKLLSANFFLHCSHIEWDSSCSSLPDWKNIWSE